MTTDPTPENVPDLDALAAWLDAEAGDDPEQEQRNRLRAVNRLDRLAGAVVLDHMAAQAVENTGAPCTIVVALDRAPGREHLPSVVAVPMHLNRRGDALTTGTVNTDRRDEVTYLAAILDDGEAMGLAPAIEVPSHAASKSERLKLTDKLGRPHDLDIEVKRQKPDADGRVSWTFTTKPRSTGKRGKPATATI